MVLTYVLIWRYNIVFDIFPLLYAGNTVIFGPDENEIWNSLALLFEFKRMPLNLTMIKSKL